MALRAASTRSLGALLAATVLVLVPAPASAAAPEYSLEERANAIVTPSLVFLEGRYKGYFRDRTSGKALSDEPVVASFRCSGFVVSANGWVVTSGHCADPTPESVVWTAAYSLAWAKVRQKALAANKVDSYAAQVVSTATFTSVADEANVRGLLWGQLGIATAGLEQQPALRGEVVTATKVDESDLALVKLAADNLPVLLADNFEINPSASFFTAGYGTGDADAVSGTYTVRTGTSKIAGTDKSGPAPRYRMDADLGGNSHGGPVFDSAGRVVGMINATIRGDKRNRLITDSTTIKSLLDSVNVANTLGPADQAYRVGLDAYFGGRYQEAISQFDKTLSASPANSLAASYRQQAAERLAIEGGASEDEPNPLFSPVVAAVAGALVLGAAGVVFALLLRRRRRPGYGPDSLMPVSANPWAPTSAQPYSAQPYSAQPGTWWPGQNGEQGAVMIPAPEHVPTPHPPVPADQQPTASQIPPPPYGNQAVLPPAADPAAQGSAGVPPADPNAGRDAAGPPPANPWGPTRP